MRLLAKPERGRGEHFPCEFLGFGNTDGYYPYEFVGFGAMDLNFPYEFGLGP